LHELRPWFGLYELKAYGFLKYPVNGVFFVARLFSCGGMAGKGFGVYGSAQTSAPKSPHPLHPRDGCDPPRVSEIFFDNSRKPKTHPAQSLAFARAALHGTYAIRALPPP